MTNSYNALRHLLIMLDEGCYFALYEKGANSIKRNNIYELFRPASGGEAQITNTYQFTLADGVLTVALIPDPSAIFRNKGSYDFMAKDGHLHFDGQGIVVGIGDVRNINNNPSPRPDVHRYNLLDGDIAVKGTGINQIEIWYVNRQVVAV
jgi:hypothetical protein